MAPELFEPGKRHSFASDVYAFAMILFKLADGRFPFQGVLPEAIPRHVEKGERPMVPRSTPALIKTLMIQSWSADPSKRPQANELVLVLKTKEDGILKLASSSPPNLKKPPGNGSGSGKSDSGYQTQQSPPKPKATPPPPPLSKSRPKPPQPQLPQLQSNPMEVGIQFSLEKADIAALRSILSSGLVQVDVVKDGVTGLHFACQNNGLHRVKVLLEFGADPRRKDSTGKLPIHLSTSMDVWRALGAKMPKPQGDLFDAAQIGDDVSAMVALAAVTDPSALLRQQKEMTFGVWKG
ncbi:hypothetical protein HDU96_004796, partial [Phlyctochytrium bullatum]